MGIAGDILIAVDRLISVDLLIPVDRLPVAFFTIPYSLVMADIKITADISVAVNILIAADVVITSHIRVSIYVRIAFCSGITFSSLIAFYGLILVNRGVPFNRLISFFINGAAVEDLQFFFGENLGNLGDDSVFKNGIRVGGFFKGVEPVIAFASARREYGDDLVGVVGFIQTEEIPFYKVRVAAVLIAVVAAKEDPVFSGFKQVFIQCAGERCSASDLRE